MYKFFRPLLFKLSKDPETVHHLALYFLKAASLSGVRNFFKFYFGYENNSLRQNIFGINFHNPVGLAGGFDKDGDAVGGLAALGFGFLELGTVTKLPQPGNPRPRIVRLVKDKALINRMGFNNKGADALAVKLGKNEPAGLPLGINFGKSKLTELSFAAEDYAYSFARLYNNGDYFVINISSPNTPGLRQLADKSNLEKILITLAGQRAKQKKYKPLLIKITVDFSREAIDEILELCTRYDIDGIVCSNTSISRDNLLAKTEEAGGLSGEPLRQVSTELIKYVHKKMPGLLIIGVGGVFSAQDAYEKIKAGASLVQIYTGFIYEGPLSVKKINRGLVQFLKRDGFKNISEAVGVENS